MASELEKSIRALTTAIHLIQPQSTPSVSPTFGIPLPYRALTITLPFYSPKDQWGMIQGVET